MPSGRAKFAVLLTEGAEQDIEAIYDHVRESDGAASAGKLLDALMAVVDSLAKLPARGSFPPELIDLGIKEYRQVFFGPYRMIYRVVEREVRVYLIADGRRDMPSLLARRVLGG